MSAVGNLCGIKWLDNSDQKNWKDVEESVHGII